MAGSIAKAAELAATIPGSFIPGQFENPANALAHYRTTGPEIWAQTDGNADIFVAGVGTGGTITGTARYLKEKDPAIRIVAVEPAKSPLLSLGQAGSHGIQGIGANFVPKLLDRSLLDEVVTVTDEEAFTAAKELARRFGILCGISAGANYHAAAAIAAANPEKTVVTLLPDSGTRYLSTGIFG
jgi:cysteine synthase A